ncbi:hypothetical protein YC2023_076610 [Brassica napus]
MDVEAMDILEGELLEDEILCQHTKEKDKAAMQKGSRRGQKTKAQEAQPKSKRCDNELCMHCSPLMKD